MSRRAAQIGDDDPITLGFFVKTNRLRPVCQRISDRHKAERGQPEHHHRNRYAGVTRPAAGPV